MCRFVYPSTTKNWNIEICAGEFSGNKDTCSGDAGGPLFVLDTINKKSKYVLAGITAYGNFFQIYWKTIYSYLKLTKPNKDMIAEDQGKYIILRANIS
jgi:hypothetical protein